MRNVNLAASLVIISVTALAGTDGRTAKDQTLYELNRGDSGTGTAGTGTIIYHGGPIMGNSVTGSPIHIYYIWYGNWAGLDGGANYILTTLANSIGGSPYFNINSTYYMTSGTTNYYLQNAVSVASPPLNWWVNDNYSQGKALTDFGAANSVEAVVKSHVGPSSTFHDLPLDATGVYFVLTTPDVNETTGFCSSYCGWHTYTTVASTNIAFAFVGDPLACPGACEWQSVGPNASSPPVTGAPGGGDGMASIITHELEEAATDPLLNAWYFSSGNETADQCAWNFGSTKTASNGAVYNMALGGLNFLIQQQWLNVGAGMCALSYSSTPDFTISATPGTQSAAPTGTTSYNINIGSLSGFSGGVTLSVTGTLPTGVSATFTGSPVTAPGTATLNITTSAAAGGSYSITVQGVSGNLTHSTTVTLNVTDFTISVSPGSRSVGQGGSTTYTVTDAALGGFSSNVNFTVTGLPSGATPGFNPTSVAGSGSSTMTITTASTTPVGTYTLTVTGSTSGGLSHSATTSLTVNAFGAFSPIRINTGGAAYTDTLGNVWSADAGYSGGAVGITTTTISGTSDQPLYQNWRTSPDFTPLIYTFNSIPNGNYTVILDFADPNAVRMGQRVFDVAINGTTVLSNFDIFQTVGQSVALQESFPVTVSGGSIAISFSKGSSPAPALINAIAIVSGSTSAPTLSSITPSSGVVGATITSVTLTGTSLTGATINPIPGITISGVTTTATSITATFAISSTATTGPQNVTVTTAGGTSTPPLTFTIHPAAPTLSSISPNNGAVGSTMTPVTLTGTNLAGATINPIPGITVSGVTTTANSITATLAISNTAATGAQNVTVTTAGGTSAPPLTFMINPAVPTLSTISPARGVVGATITPVTLTGTNLAGATINPIPGITISGVITTATSITATFAISSTATPGAQTVTVTTAGGTSSNTPPLTFTINAAGFTPIRIDAGSTIPYTDSSGNVWSADADYTGGFIGGTTKTISGTPDTQLYKTWRGAPDAGSVTYTFTGLPNSSRTVILDFADPNSTTIGQRLFNVVINGTTVLSNFDIFNTAGASTALTLSFPVSVTSGQIVIQFTSVKLNAIINAIAIQ